MRRVRGDNMGLRTFLTVGPWDPLDKSTPDDDNEGWNYLEDFRNRLEDGACMEVVLKLDKTLAATFKQSRGGMDVVMADQAAERWIGL